MRTFKYNIVDFIEDPYHFKRCEILLTVKSFDLLAIRKRYLKSRSRSKTGSVERRKPAQGGLVYLTVDKGKIVHSEILAKIRESRGVDIHHSKIAVSSEDRIFIFTKENDSPVILEHPWLSYIHTVRFDKKAQHLLVSSSGLDSLIEFDLRNQKVCWEWVAWEHGLNEGENPETGQKHILTRNKGEADRLRAENINVIYITKDRNQSLPTALRAAFMNSAEYSGNNKVLATLFHHGYVIEISKKKSTWKIIYEGMSKPHGGLFSKDVFLVTDTGGGRVILQRDKFYHEYNFWGLPGKSSDLENLEWLQFSRIIENTIITIDSNRNAMIFLDIDAKKRMSVSYDKDWALQEFTFMTGRSKETIPNLKNWFKT